jgi:Arc/MetJ family transcription regulator
MRTNIELDDALVREARKHSQARTKRALVEEALVTFIRVQTERKRADSYAARLRDVQARLSALRLREPPSELLREDRSR